MKYLKDETILGFQEIPGEISLLIPITSCPFLCAECHSPHYRQDIGEELEIDTFIQAYKGKVSCFCFMGGDQFPYELLTVLMALKQANFKTALYTGNTSVSLTLLSLLDFVKLGGYDPICGPLNQKTTNQRLFRVADITYKFWKDL